MSNKNNWVNMDGDDTNLTELFSRIPCE